MAERRYLTTEEIDRVVKDVFSIEYEHAHPMETTILQRQKTILRSLLQRQTIYPQIIGSLVSVLQSKLAGARASPGECVGVLCAQSIGERQTQMTLNTFHAAGMTVDTVITGVPRFLELLNASKEPKLSSSTCFVHPSLKHVDVACLKERLTKNLIHITLRNLYTHYDILEKTRIAESRPYWYNMFDEIYGRHRSNKHIYKNASYLVRFHLDKEGLFRYHLHMYEIAEKMEEHFEDIYCVFSPDHEAVLDVYMDLTDVVLPTDEAQGSTSDVVIDPVNDEDGVEAEADDDVAVRESPINIDHLHFLNGENKDLFYLEEVFIPCIQEHRLFGLPNIVDYFIQYDQQEDTYTLHTKGNNFVRLLGCPFLDATRVISNNMWNIYEVLGIEAARAFLVSEFTNIVSSDGTFINKCHIELLVDIMTFSGSISSISRYGMKNDQFGALAKASFEESLENFLKAGFFSQEEKTSDVSASIICGKRSNVGTGICDVLFQIGT